MTSLRYKNLLILLTLFGTLFLLHTARASDKDVDFDDDLGEAASVVAGSEDDEFDVKYESPVPIGPYNFAEHFDDVDGARKRWVISKAQKEEQDNVFKYEGKWDFEFPQKRLFPNDQALVIKSKAKHHAISAKLKHPFEFNHKPLIVQYEVTFQNGMDCGGAYIKLLSHAKDMHLETFNDQTPYTIMFGPDKCGSDVKMHFIFRHKNPINGSFSEKHAKRPSNRVEDTYSDKKPHLYRLKLMNNNKFEIFVDGRLINQGSLLEDVEPKVNPPMEIEDPNDVKPEDWDEREKIPDESVKKPEDWDDDAPLKIVDVHATAPTGWLTDEQPMIPDPTAVKPDDWDESMDGSWEPPLINNPKCEGVVGCGTYNAPLIDNPKFKGKWKAPLINNANYKGKWTRRTIPNPHYFEDKEPFKMTPIGAVGLELWTMSDLVLFDNFLITDDEEVADDWTEKTWELKRRIYDRDSEGVFRRLLNYSNAHPWLWAIYVFVIGLPLVLIFTYCCGSSQEKKFDESQYKKTDEPSADDILEEPPAAPVTAAAKVVAANNSRPNSKAAPAMTKDDLEDDVDSSQHTSESESDQDDDKVEEIPIIIASAPISRRRKGRRE